MFDKTGSYVLLIKQGCKTKLHKAVPYGYTSPAVIRIPLLHTILPLLERVSFGEREYYIHS